MKNTKTIEKTIKGINFIFILTRTITPLYAGNHNSYRWTFGEKNDCVHNCAMKAKTVREQLPYLVKAATI